MTWVGLFGGRRGQGEVGATSRKRCIPPIMQWLERWT